MRWRFRRKQRINQTYGESALTLPSHRIFLFLGVIILPKVSIIVPVHNPGKYLKPLLNSLIRQTFTDIEILLIDDGSTDGSRDILKEYEKKDNRIQVYFRDKDPTENFGEKKSVDLGREKASGNYIMIVDHDDELMLNAIEILYSYTDNNTIDVIQGRNISINENNELVYATTNLWPTVTVLKHISNLTQDQLWNHLTQGPIALWACLIRKDFQKNLELGDYVFNDTDFIWKLKITAETFCYIPDYIYKQNEHKDSTSGSLNNNKYVFEIFKCFDNLEKFLKEQSVNYDIWQYYTLYAFRMLLGHSGGNFTQENYQKFLDKIKSVLLRNPDISYLLPPDYSQDYINILHRN